MNRLQWFHIWGFNAIQDRHKQRARGDRQEFAALLRRLSACTPISVRAVEEVEV